MSRRVGVYVDAENVRMNGGFGMRYDVLRRFAERGGGRVQRLNTYVAIDRERWETDPSYKDKQQSYQQRLREFGWYIHEKTVRRFQDEDGSIVMKANADMEFAIDALIQSDRLDRVILVTGDGDFCRLVRALRDKGCRVELIGFENVSHELKRAADLFVSGYLVPGLLPVDAGGEWGAEGSRVRGLLRYGVPDKNIGFVFFLERIDGNIWVVDDRHPDSPYGKAVVLREDLPRDVDLAAIDPAGIPLEFSLRKNSHPEPRYIAKDCRRVVGQARSTAS